MSTSAYEFLCKFVGKAVQICPSLITTLILPPSLEPSTIVVRPTVVDFDAGSVATSEIAFMILSLLQPAGNSVFPGTAGGEPFHTAQTNAVEFSGAPSFAPLFHAKGGGLESPRSDNAAKYNPSFLSLTVVSISTNIQRPTNVLA